METTSLTELLNTYNLKHWCLRPVHFWPTKFTGQTINFHRPLILPGPGLLPKVKQVCNKNPLEIVKPEYSTMFIMLVTVFSHCPKYKHFLSCLCVLLILFLPFPILYLPLIESVYGALESRCRSPKISFSSLHPFLEWIRDIFSTSETPKSLCYRHSAATTAFTLPLQTFPLCFLSFSMINRFLPYILNLFTEHFHLALSWALITEF